MTAIQIARITPQDEVGIPVTLSALADIVALSTALENYGYHLILNTGGEYIGFGRITVRREEFGDQFANEGDWLKVSNAKITRDDKGSAVWEVGKTTEVTVYSNSYPAQPYTADEFSEQFKPVDDIDSKVMEETAMVTAKISKLLKPAAIQEPLEPAPLVALTAATPAPEPEGEPDQ